MVECRETPFSACCFSLEDRIESTCKLILNAREEIKTMQGRMLRSGRWHQVLKTFSTCILEAPLRVQETQTFRLRRQTNKKSTKDTGANGTGSLPLTLVSADDGSRTTCTGSTIVGGLGKANNW